MLTEDLKKAYEEIKERKRGRNTPASENASFLLSGLIGRFDSLKVDILNRDDEASADDVLQCLAMFNAHVINSVVNAEDGERSLYIDYIGNNLIEATKAAIKGT